MTTCIQGCRHQSLSQLTFSARHIALFIYSSLSFASQSFHIYPKLHHQNSLLCWFHDASFKALYSICPQYISPFLSHYTFPPCPQLLPLYYYQPLRAFLLGTMEGIQCSAKVNRFPSCLIALPSLPLTHSSGGFPDPPEQILGRSREASLHEWEYLWLHPFPLPASLAWLPELLCVTTSSSPFILLLKPHIFCEAFGLTPEYNYIFNYVQLHLPIVIHSYLHFSFSFSCLFIFRQQSFLDFPTLFSPSPHNTWCYVYCRNNECNLQKYI